MNLLHFRGKDKNTRLTRMLHKRGRKPSAKNSRGGWEEEGVGSNSKVGKKQ